MNQRRIWIVAATTFAFLCATGVGASIYRDYAVTYKAILAENDARVRLMVAHAEQGLFSVSLALGRISEALTTVSPGDRKKAEQIRQRLADLVSGSPAASTIWITDEAGRSWVNNHGVLEKTIDVSRQSYYVTQRRDPSRLHVGPVEIGLIVARERFTISHSILGSEGTFRGAVIAGIDVAYLKKIYRRVQAAPHVMLLAFDGAGNVLATSPDLDGATVARARRALPGDAPARAAAVIGDWYYSSMRINAVPMTFVSAVDLEKALGAWRMRTIRLAGFGLLMMLSFLALTLQGLKAVRREEAMRAELMAANETLESRVRERTATVELLFRELNHRVRNNLQMVASLLRLQMRRTTDAAAKAALQDSIGRVFAISDVHSEIEQASGGEINLRRYVDKIVMRICEAMRKPGQEIKVILDIADVPLALDRAVLLAIAVNEMVTNAFKHSFANRAEGRLEVSVKAENDRLFLRIFNDMPAMAVQSAATSHIQEKTTDSGLGSGIVGMLVQQLSGQMNVNDSHGYEVLIKVPRA